MVSLVPMTFSIIWMILVLNLVACQASRVKRAYEDDGGMGLLEMIKKIIGDESEQATKRSDHSDSGEEIAKSVVEFILSCIVIVVVIWACCQCCRSHHSYRHHGK